MSLRGTSKRGRQKRSNERGASAVEAAIVTPMVFALFFGIFEMGFLFKDYLAVAGAARAGVRMASANPRNATFAQAAADNVALIGGAMDFKNVQQLWVYKVTPACPTCALTDKPVGFTDFSNCTVCVKFTWDAGLKKFCPPGGCTTPNVSGWLASTQNACSSSTSGVPTDRIGVYIQLRHDAFTKFVFNTVNISEASIMTLEPMPVLTGCGP